MKTIDAYKEVVITNHHAGFGMYELGEANGEAWAFSEDIIGEISSNGVSFLSLDEALQDARYIDAGAEDIKGRIYGGDPDEIYVILEKDYEGKEYVYYFGIIEVKVAENYWD